MTATRDTKRSDSQLTKVIQDFPGGAVLGREARRIDYKRLLNILLGASLFLAVYLSPPWSAAVDPAGDAFVGGGNRRQ